MRRLSTHVASCLLLGFCALPACAQSLGAPDMRSVTPAVQGRAEQKNLRSLPVGLKDFRLSGEWDELAWPVYVTEAQARETARFQIATQSSISVMPESSSLSLTINDTLVGRRQISAAEAFSKQDFEIPKGLLKTGFNEIRIKAEQRHRVDCALAATYELWTALNPAQTGLVFGRARRGFEHAADIAAIAPRGDGAGVIRIILNGKLTQETAGRALRASQIVALVGRSLHPIVEFGASGTDDYGLDLAIGTADELRATFDLAHFGAITGPRSGFLPDRPDHPPVFVITGRNGADLDAAIERLKTEAQAEKITGTDSGRRAVALQWGREASGEAEQITLGQTGFASADFSGRLFRLGVTIAMPMDFMVADYDRMSLRLAGSYRGGLERDARILVAINGRNAATQMLNRNGAENLETNRMFLPLGLMRPGLNRIEIAAEVPSQTDAACLSGADADASRLRLLDHSELGLPRVARVARAPDLAMTAAGAFPFVRAEARPILFVPNPDRATMSAAATLAARLAMAARRPLDFTFTMVAPALDAGDVLMVSPAPGLDPKLMRAAGLDPERVRRAWQAERRRPLTNATRQFEPDGNMRHCDLPPEEPAQAAHVEPASFRLGGLLSAASLPFGRGARAGESASEDEVLSPASVLMASQGFPGEGAAHLWTVFTAPDSALLKAGVECLSHPLLWSGLNGRLSALGSNEALISLHDDDPKRYIATGPASIGNARLVTAAWLSLNPFVYVLACLVLVLCLAASTLWLVLNTGRRVE